MLKDWRIEALTGYKPHTNFYVRFSMAEPYGITALADVYNTLSTKNANSVVNMTELVLVLQWKIYEHYDNNKILTKFYQSMWEIADKWCRENLQGNDLKYFEDITK